MCICLCHGYINEELDQILALAVKFDTVESKTKADERKYEELVALHKKKLEEGYDSLGLPKSDEANLNQTGNDEFSKNSTGRRKKRWHKK